MPPLPAQQTEPTFSKRCVPTARTIFMNDSGVVPQLAVEFPRIAVTLSVQIVHIDLTGPENLS